MQNPNEVRLSFARTSAGSGMTRIERLNLHPRLKEDLLKELKKRFGCGGTVKNGVLELQGDRRDAVELELRTRGYRVKRVGS